MNTQQEVLIADLRSLIANLGKDGGQMSASVYDTAQVLRFSPPQSGVEPGLEWLKSQQQMDGGWGNLAAPLSRHIPTLAAIVALQTYAHDFETREIIQEGLYFLIQNSYQWQPPLPEELPTAVELIFPRLLHDAQALGLDIPYEPYRALLTLGEKKRQIIVRLQPKAGTPPVFSWEAWGTEPETDIIDETGSVGHNPAATAYWLKLAEGRDDLLVERECALEYLAKASAATGLDIPGAMPDLWPINRYEQVFVLHTLQMAGLLEYAPLQDVVKAQIRTLANAITPTGLGLSDYFESDGDDTLAAAAVLTQSGYDVDPKIIKRYQNATHFLTYPYEMQPGPSVTTRGLHVLNLLDDLSMPAAESFLMKRQTKNGSWLGDKWNTSWYYMTYLSSFALSISKTGAVNGEVKAAASAILSSQNPDGGWSTTGLSNFSETAYAVLTLQLGTDEKCKTAVRRAYHWMLENYAPFATSDVNCWLGKQNYRPIRVDHGFELAAMLSASMQENEEHIYDTQPNYLFAVA